MDAPAAHPGEEARFERHADVPPFKPSGAAVWTGEGSTLRKVRRLLELDPSNDPAIIAGEGWFGRLESMLSSLAPIERESVRIAPLSEGDVIDAWRNCTADTFL